MRRDMPRELSRPVRLEGDTVGELLPIGVSGAEEEMASISQRRVELRRLLPPDEVRLLLERHSRNPFGERFSRLLPRESISVLLPLDNF